MAISLQKGQKVDLTKGNPGLSKIMVGLGWDPVKQQSKGLLGSLFGAKDADIDCDASVLMLSENDKLSSNNDLIYFGNLRSKCGSILHTGDNLTGEGDGDDEEIIVELAMVPQNIKKLFFVVNIYDCIKRGQDFGMLENAFIRIVDMNTKTELLRYNLNENYSGKTAVMVAEIYRNGNDWKFGAIGEGTRDTSLSDIAKRF